MLLVHPIPRDRWIVKLPQQPTATPTRRRSPKHATAFDVFRELVSFPELIAHENFTLDVVLTEEETVWRFDGHRRWRRRGWAMVERRLLAVHDTLSLRDASDYTTLLPPGLPAPFLTSDLATALACNRDLAQKAAYCLRHAGLIHQVGARGNAILYTQTTSP